MGQLVNFFHANLPWLATGLLAFVVAAVMKVAPDLFRLEKIPLVGKELGNTEKRRIAYLRGARGLYTKGYHQVRTRGV